MKRELRTPRPNHIESLEKLGLTFHTVDGQAYWNESAAYRFELAEILHLEKVTNELHNMCLEAVEKVISERDFDRFGIPEAARQVIVDAWDADPPAIYGRFDLAYDGTNEPKLLEYNADTPTSLLEAAVIQWHWLEEAEPEADQFNSIWEGLIEKWTDLKSEGFFKSGLVHFASMDEMEDLMTTAVLMDTAKESGLDVRLMDMRQIGWDHNAEEFVDPTFHPIESLFKLYPWEWMVQDGFGPNLLKTYNKVNWIEPIWKMVLSNKVILAVLWEMYPDHPNLLPAYLDGPRDLVDYVKKPILGREGANVTIVSQGHQIEQDGPYADTGFVYQAYAPLPIFDGSHAVIGSWVIDGFARGIGIRESDGPITQDLARFVPHYFINPALKAE